MDIVSFQYILFLAITFFAYYLLSQRFKRYVLCVSSFAFYFIGQPNYIVILLISVLVNYSVGFLLYQKSAPKRLIFYLSLLFNIGLLIYFKYLGYWLSLLNPSLNVMPIQSINILSNLILPIGISFYTFNAIGYTTDVYLSLIKPEKNFVNYFVYQVFFSHVLSGPVAKSRQFLPQLHKSHELSYDIIVSGLRLILLGYFKKLVIANGLRPYVDATFNNYTFHNGTTLFFASFLYFCQLYADFSGYTDVALGTARLFGFNLIENFNKPFLSRSVTDFWRRWHISLSSWVRDYLYYPIFYSLRKHKHLSFILSTLISFFIIGMWHGPKATYALFGVIQFVLITIEFYIAKVVIIRNKSALKFVSLLQIPLTVVIFSLCLIFLRAENIQQAFGILHRIFSTSGRVFIPEEVALILGIFGFAMLFFGEIISGQFELSNYISKQSQIIRWAVYFVLMSMILVFGVFDNKAFIYYQF